MHHHSRAACLLSCLLVCLVILPPSDSDIFLLAVLLNLQSWDGQDTILYTLPPCDQSPFWTSLQKHRIKVMLARSLAPFYLFVCV